MEPQKYVLLSSMDGMVIVNLASSPLDKLAWHTSHKIFKNYWEAWGLKCKIEQGLVSESQRLK